ncbi:glycosyltransferase family 4 protein [Entomospira culicis]|uniref:Glycosyltransferase family 4 protein n=1 Tax=Entomospira culicis TaxID=2719989 RepID=A0A968GDY5_9SPIO|nr:glycosyltransferase family 1 protein [Entomospira culicis]NIZ18616.1 glycosyltransferase family 4 protein [Entomospira culicis]NIZ68831.1 glycosyltransferase family 4 protein [Entomospira culicis]WDI37425.1 glycosyltransferase family 1 protein [Entomospira culicis]WDI39053.1 glycosyltransferase family 1 protein [Entomospira culicis]
MKIIVNARFLCTRATGVQRFAFEISRYLKRLDHSIEFLCPHNIQQDAWADELGAKVIGHFQGHLWEQIDLFRYLKRQPNAILFSPGNTGPLFVKQQLLVLHDVAFLTNPQAFNWKFRLYYRFLIKRLSKNVAKITTVSDFSRQEILSFYPHVQEKIHVVYNGITRFPRNLSQYVGKPYFLVVGSFDPRKNIPFIIETYRKLPEENRPRLKIVGGFGKTFKKENFGTIPSDVEFVGQAGDDTLARLYSNATALLFPSIYEGFGLPPVEAMSFGTPCLVSDIPVLHEVLKDAALFLPINNEELWIDALIQIQQDKELRNSLKERGLLQSQKFSWEVSANQIYQHLKEIAPQ